MEGQGHMEGEGMGAVALSGMGAAGYDGQSDYIISDYMERLGTRLNILETELKYAWRALDLLSQEYIKMWERLERLEGLLCEQQGVIAHLLDFYTAERGTPASRLGQLEVIREILGNGTVEDGLEEGVEATGVTARMLIDVDEDPDDMQLVVPDSDEAFYRSLNRAYREDLVCNEPSRPSSQLDMIWEDPEDSEDPHAVKDEVRELMEQALEDERQEVFSAMDYKDYRGNSPCVSERDLAQLSRLSSIDQIAIEKLHELDRLTTKLQKDSQDLKELKSRLISPQHVQLKMRDDKEVDSRTLVEDGNIIDEQLRQIYADSENWSFSSGPRGIEELMLLAASAVPAAIPPPPPPANRSSSRLSIADSTVSTDKEVADAMAGGFRSPNVTSPRHKYHVEKSATTEPYTTVTGRLAYNSAVANVDSHAKPPKSPGALSRDRFDLSYAYGETDYNKMYGNNFTSQNISNEALLKTADKPVSPTLSVHSMRTRQDGYIESAGRLNIQQPEVRNNSSSSPSPPPPAPRDGGETFLMPESTMVPGPHRGPSPVYLTATSQQATLSAQHDHGRLSPRSPKSPRTSPRHAKKDPPNIVPAKSDSGLSSMSGWSSLEKSPGSPRTNKVPLTSSHLAEHQKVGIHRAVSPNPSANQPVYSEAKRYLESDMDSQMLAKRSSSTVNMGHHSSAFSSVKSPQPIENGLEAYEQYMSEFSQNGTMDVSSVIRRTMGVPEPQQSPAVFNEFYYRNEQPAIYSVAGSNRQQTFTTVYTSGSSNLPQNYPDIIESYNDPMLAAQASPQRYPPEPNYRAQTLVHPQQSAQAHTHAQAQAQAQTHAQAQAQVQAQAQAQAGRKPLTRGVSVGSMPTEGLANHEGYRNAMHRTMFPSGNITDALSYYPTSARYDSAAFNLPRKDYNDPAAWLASDGSQLPHDSTSSSMDTTASMTSQTMANNMQATKQYQNQLQQEYFRHQQREFEQQNNNQPIYQNAQMFQNPEETRDQQNHREWSQGEYQQGDQDLRHRNLQEQQQQTAMRQQSGEQYYNTSGLLVSHSGYLSISSDLKNAKTPEKVTKKPKRGSLKQAMSSVSSWLPDLHLPKRNRSLSLPSGVDRDDVVVQKAPKPEPKGKGTGPLPRKKKKYPLVATMSGILQKAKRKTNTSSQSLSDPETSENEWSGGRSSAQSEDSDSVFSDAPLDGSMFARIASNKKQRRLSQQEKMDQQQKIQQQQLQQQSQQLARVQPQCDSQPQFELMSQSQEIPENEQLVMRDSPPKNVETVSNYSETSPPQPVFAQIKKRHSKDRDQLSDGHKTEPETDLSDNAPGEEEGNKSSGSQSGSSSIFATIGDVKRREGSDESGGESRSYGMSGGSMEFAVSRALGKYRLRQSSSISDDQICLDDPAPKPDDLATFDETEETAKETHNEPEFKTTQHIVKPPEIVRSLSVEEPSTIPEGSPSAQSIRSHSNRFMPRHQQSLDVPFSRHDDEDNKSTHSWRSGSRVSSRRQSTEDSIDSEDEWYCYELRKLEEMERQSVMDLDRNEPLTEEPEFEKDSSPFEPDEDVKEKMSFVLRELRIKRKPIEGVLTADDMKRETIQQTKRRNSNSRNQSPLTAPKSAYAEFARVTDYQTWKEADELKEAEDIVEEPVKPEESDIEEDDRDDDGDESSGETSGPDSPGEQSADELDDEPVAMFSLSQPASQDTDPTSPPPQKDGPLGSKWKLLKTLKERKAEEKSNQETAQAAAATEKDKVSTSVSYLMQKFYEIRVKS